MLREGLAFGISLILIINAFSFTVGAIPLIINNSDVSVGAGDSYVVNATVVEHHEVVASVWVEYWFDGGGKTNVSMINTAGNYWEYNSISIPLSSDDDLYYNISASNSKGVWNHLNNIHVDVVVTDASGT